MAEYGLISPLQYLLHNTILSFACPTILSSFSFYPCVLLPSDVTEQTRSVAAAGLDWSRLAVAALLEPPRRLGSAVCVP